MDYADKKKVVTELLRQHYGKIFSVEFVKKNGETRKMLARQGVKNGSTPLKGGEWANGNAGSPSDHDLILVTDINLEKQGGHSRRSIPINGIKEITVAGTTLTFE